MKPQDIAVLLKIIASGDTNWQNQDLSWALSLSAPEISESFNRSQIAGLLDGTKKNVARQSMMECLEHGLHYVSPAASGSLTRGIPTVIQERWG